MTADAKTLGVYATETARYASLAASDSHNRTLQTFADALPPGGHVLDLGCGPGHSAAALVDMGFRVTATDGSAEFIAIVPEKPGLTAYQAYFDDLNDARAFDGVWANFSLLHAPKAEMPGHLARVHRALKPGGRLSLGLKTGTGEKRDALGRFYSYYERAELDGLLAAAGFIITGHTEGQDEGLDGTFAPWIVVSAHA